MKKGIAAKTIDSLIASLAINNDLFLISYDKDFEIISNHSKLKILNFKDYKKISVN